MWSLPFVAALTFGQTQSSNLTLLVSGSFLFGGPSVWPRLGYLSCQYQRWGWFKQIWLPTKKPAPPLFFVPLPSDWHCFANLLPDYLDRGFWDTGIGNCRKNWPPGWTWEDVVLGCWRSLCQHPIEFFAVYVGLEFGAMSHYLSDWGGSAYKRFKKQELKELRPPGSIKKRKRQPRRRTSSKSKR